MNFQIILEELNRLYEGENTKVAEEESVEEVLEEAFVEEPETEAISEAAEDEEVLIDDESIIDDEVEEVVEETETQVVLECANCGALTLRVSADIVATEDNDLVNVEEACQYCEESKGYKILGNLVPVEEAEAPLDEGLFDKRVQKTIKASEVKKGDKIFIDSSERYAKVKKIEINGRDVAIDFDGGNMDVSVDTEVSVLTK